MYLFLHLINCAKHEIITLKLYVYHLRTVLQLNSIALQTVGALGNVVKSIVGLRSQTLQTFDII